MNRTVVCVLGGVLAAAGTARGQILSFDLGGRAGPGLNGGNEAPTAVAGGGSGGELGEGIRYNNATNELSIRVGWGGGNGFTNLTTPAILGHIHGPTPSNAPASFNEAVGILRNLHTLPGWNHSATSGGFNGTVILTEVEQAQMMDGRLYLNFHTSVNPGGEIRGQIVTTETMEDADFDADGDVDGADFLTWQRGVGTTAGGLRGDGNANPSVDGDVDGDDLAVWINQFGVGDVTAMVSVVPESRGIAHWLLAGMCLLCRANRNGRLTRRGS